VMRYTEGSWQDVGAPGFSDGTASYLSLAFHDDEPYLAYQDNANGSRGTVMRYTAGSWSALGGTAFTAARVDHTSLTFVNGEANLSFMDWDNDLKITLMRYTAGNWEAVGGAGFSDGEGTHTHVFAIGNQPYVGFRDLANGNGATVGYYVYTSVPTVTTTAVTDVTATTATSGGNVTDDGGADVTARGVCWSTAENPDIDDDKTADGVGTGAFSSAITGLEPNTNYYVRAYATNLEGTSYGNQVSFTTEIAPPTVTTADITAIGTSTATGGGEVLAEGGGAVAGRGVCWSTAEEPTIADEKTEDGAGLGAFESAIAGLSPNQTYYVRAYATNQAGTGYGAQKSFTTNAALATVTTAEISEITHNSATGGGEVTDDGGDPPSARGVCWSVLENPTLADAHSVDGGGAGAFISGLTDLDPFITYYVRAYATNLAGTAYGNERSFTTTQALATVRTLPVMDLTEHSVSVRGQVTRDGGSEVAERGVCIGAEVNPTIDGYHLTKGAGLGTFSVEFAGLQANTQYYLRAYATNDVGTAYGSCVAVTTPATVPSVYTHAAGPIMNGVAALRGQVINDGGSPVEARGLCYDQAPNPTVLGEHVLLGAGVGPFSHDLGGLDPNRTYYVRAYAENAQGLAYGNQISFDTPREKPVVLTGAVSDVQGAEAVISGEVLCDGGGELLEWGVCWSTGPDPSVASARGPAEAGLTHFSVRLSGLAPDTRYYARCYATNEVGTAYGAVIAFTSAAALPAVGEVAVSGVTTNSAQVTGEVLDDHGHPVLARGLCWGTMADPDTSDPHIRLGTGVGSFEGRLEDLAPGVTYYVRAFASNHLGTAYGPEAAFETGLAMPRLWRAAVCKRDLPMRRWPVAWCTRPVAPPSRLEESAGRWKSCQR